MILLDIGRGISLFNALGLQRLCFRSLEKLQCDCI